MCYSCFCLFFSSRRRHTRCALVTGVQTCALPIFRCRVNPDRWSGRYGHEKRKQGARRAAIMLAGRWERCRAKCLPQYTSRHQRPCNDRQGQKSCSPPSRRSDEHTSELQSLMRISYAVFCLKTKQPTIHEYNTERKKHVSNYKQK